MSKSVRLGERLTQVYTLNSKCQEKISFAIFCERAHFFCVTLKT